MHDMITGEERYRIVKLIAEGGMGRVFLARKLGVAGFEKVVAIKMMHDSLSNDPAHVANFIEEAKLVANLIHENIVQIYSLDRCKEGYYFVIEYVDGVSLFDFMEMHRISAQKLPVELAVFIAARIARGLAYAHSRCDNRNRKLGIVHCDICPHNILINTEGVPKITDFGIARAVNHDGLTGKLTGKLGYMSPEQAVCGGGVDFRADIYSLGLVVFEMLAGRPARRALPEVKAMVELIRSGELQWPLLPEGLPAELLGLLRRMLATDPAEHYADTSALARDLEYFIYKDGYGPTIVTLAEYMRKLMPGRFGAVSGEISEYDRTVVI